MTRYYTHTSELAAANAVALLPSVMGDAQAHCNGSPEDSENILLKIERIAKSLTSANWKTKKAALLALLPTSEQSALHNQGIA